MNSSPDRSSITAILDEIRTLSSEEARNRLFEAVYDELRRLARGLMRDERPGHSFRPTELVHEAFARMVVDDGVSWESRAHFFGIAARAMRHILVEHARERATLKRGGGRARVSLEDRIDPAGSETEDLLILHDALDRLAALDERAARVAEMRVFAGMGSAEIAHLLGVSRRTVEGDWLMARTWLSRELSGGQR